MESSGGFAKDGRSSERWKGKLLCNLRQCDLDDGNDSISVADIFDILEEEYSS